MKLNPSKWSTRDLCTLALLMALAIAFTRLYSLRLTLVGVEGVRIGLGRLPTVLAALIYGPIGGMLVGGLADGLGFWVSPMGPYNPIFTFTAALSGLWPGLVFMFTNRRYNWLNIGLAVLASCLHTIIIVSWAISALFNVPFTALAVPRALAECIHLPLYTVLLIAICKALQKVIHFQPTES